MPYFLGIDVSTTATKALLINETGEVVSVASNPHRLSTPRPLWSEQDPLEWWNATRKSISQVLGASGLRGQDIAAVGLTGQMHGLVMLNENGDVLRPAILWNDGRAFEECDWLREQLGLDRLVELTGNNAFEGFTLPKLLWVKRHEPEIYARVRQILLPKDYIRYRLTGAYATDKAGAGGTLMLDLRTRDWSPEILSLCEIPREWLPNTHEGPEIAGQISKKAAELTGLKAGTPVVGGGGDQAAQAVGVGAVRPGIVAVTLGTSGVVFASTQEPVVAPGGAAHAFPHAVPNRWHMMGVMLSAAGSLNWYREAFAPGVPYETLLHEIETVPPGSEGLFFLPYLSGERTPHANPHATGAFFGLTLRHNRGHVTRSVLEGVAFGLRDNFRLLREAGVDVPEEVRISGGGVRSPLWRQVIADVLGVPLVSMEASEGAAYGTALLAGVSAGTWPDVETACETVIRKGGVTEPHAATSERYDRAYRAFTELYPALAPLYRSDGS